MDLISFALNLMSATIILVTTPFTLVIRACMFGLRTVFIIVHTWAELLTESIRFHVKMFWNAVFWTLAVTSLPIRVLTAVQREMMLELHLNEMHMELENVMWERKQLEGHLQTAITERKMMDLMLEELEEEHDKAMVKIDVLESELQDLNNENLQMKEIQGRGIWNLKDKDDMSHDQIVSIALKDGISYGIPSWKSEYEKSGISPHDILLYRDVPEFFKSESKTSGPTSQPLTHEKSITTTHSIEIIDQQREIALSQSIFSAVLSLLVGMIIWKAEDPCVPLVVALFTVVGMSLKSVVGYFYTLRNKPAYNAVTLLSFNWFALGTLTYPTLPRVAHLLAPLALRFGDAILSCLGLSILTSTQT